MKAKRKKTNWRKRAEEANEAWSSCARLLSQAEIHRDVWKSRFESCVPRQGELQRTIEAQDRRERESVEKYNKIWNECEDLRGQIEVGDALLDKQRERLIRLTEIKNRAVDLLHYCRKGRRVSATTYEITGRCWIRIDDSDLQTTACQLSEAIAALEVDTAVPQKGARP